MKYGRDRIKYMHRKVRLYDGWYRDAILPILLTPKTGLAGAQILAVPGSFGGYYYTDPDTGKKIRITKKRAKGFNEDAISLYLPFENKKIGIKDLIRYRIKNTRPIDYIMTVLITLASSGIALLMPYFTKTLTGRVLDSKSTMLLLGIGIFMLATLFTQKMLDAIKTITSESIRAKTGLCAEAAAMQRLLSLPLSFFRKHTSGEIYLAYKSVGELSDTLSAGTVIGAVSFFTGLAYIGQIINFAPHLLALSLFIIITTAILSGITSKMQADLGKKTGEFSSKENSVIFDLITGMAKIKQAGAEKAAYKNWEENYEKVAKLRYDPPAFIKLAPMITTALKLFGWVFIYYIAADHGMSTSSYLAFSTAYGGLLAAFASLSDIFLSLAGISAVYKLASPILDSVPDDESKKEIIKNLSGEIDIKNVSFAYEKDKPVLKDISLHINPGEFVAITGETGCGKTTLIRLLLGLEKPDSGTISYDKKDISDINLKSLRKNIGAVIQDAKLMTDDLFTNITIGHDELTIDDAWEAARTARIADEIKAHPLGMYITTSEQDDWFSGGERQRILIARAIAHKPNVLMFDEATSALDSKLQSEITEAIEKMGATRIVVAHRLSTIRHADKIIYIEDQKIAFSGTYEELVVKYKELF